MRKVFLLGAGFSKPAGYPLNHELPSEIVRIALADANQHAGTQFSGNESISEIKAHPGAQHLLPAFFLKQEARQNKGYDIFQRDAKSQEDLKNREWVDIFERRVVYKSDVENLVHDSLAQHFDGISRRGTPPYAKKLVEFCHQTQSPIYTTNFDLLLERACGASHLVPDVKGTIPSEHGPAPTANFPIYKLHGSLDWDPLPHFYDTELSEFPVRYRRNSYTRGYQHIGLDADEKLSQMAMITPCLCNLHKDLRINDDVICLGQSFSDPHIRAILGMFLMQRKIKLSCVDPGPNLPEMIQGLDDYLKKEGTSPINHIKESAETYCLELRP